MEYTDRDHTEQDSHQTIDDGRTPGPNGHGAPGDVNDYSADKIKVLEGLEAVRKRPAMYIGSTGPAGLHHLVYEVVDNSIDEALAGFCDQVNVTIHIDGSVTVVDNGRGIPVDRHASGKSAAEVVLTVLHAGGKFDNDSYKVSGGLHGVGVSVVNALSETLDLEIWRNGQVYQQSYERGRPDGGARDHRHDEAPRHQGHVQARHADLRDDRLQLRHARAAAARAGVPERRHPHHARRRARRQERTSSTTKAASSRSSTHLNKNKTAVNEKPIYMHGEKDGIDVEIALQWNDSYAEIVYSFANNINTHEGGTHLSGFRAALTRTINCYATKNNLAKDLKESVTGEDIREGLTGGHQRQDSAPAVRRPDQDQARQHRGQGHRRSDRQRQAGRVSRREPGGRRAGLSARRSTRPARAKRRARRATSSGARARSTAARCPASSPTARNAIPALSELYIVEGESAGGSAKQGRDRRFQAILPLKGKILNVEKARFDKMLGSDEIKTMIAALGCGIGAEDFDSTSCATTASSS